VCDEGTDGCIVFLVLLFGWLELEFKSEKGSLEI
jgi:hypothetical protein